MYSSTVPIYDAQNLPRHIILTISLLTNLSSNIHVTAALVLIEKSGVYLFWFYEDGLNAAATRSIDPIAVAPHGHQCCQRRRGVAERWFRHCSELRCQQVGPFGRRFVRWNRRPKPDFSKSTISQWVFGLFSKKVAHVEALIKTNKFVHT